MSPYRKPAETHVGLESACRKCSANGHLYLYFPISVPAGPLCRACFVQWRGLSVNMRFGTIGAGGYYAWPVEDRGGFDARYSHDNTVTVDGPRPDEGPLRGPPPLPRRPFYEEISFLSRLVRWFS